MIAIKDTATLISMMHGFHPTLVDIAVWLEEMYSRTVITCGYRPGDEGVHGTSPCRGLDLRSWVYPDAQKVVDHVNTRWQYDHRRPKMLCAILHDVGSGRHIHLQVHPRTRLYKIV